MLKAILILSAIAGFSGVALGAGAAHALQGRLSAQALEWLETGLRYQMYHAAALVALAAFMAVRPLPALTVAGFAWVAGIVLFSGSLYLLAFTGVRGIAHITPFGGLAFLVGWAAVAWAGVQAVRP